MNSQIKSVLTDVLEKFKNTDTIPQAIALVSYPQTDLPMTKWSLLNQLICFFTGLSDFRGYRQWRKAKRFVKKGEKATYILVPHIEKCLDEYTKEEIPVLAGFLTTAVFAVEQTEGEPLQNPLLQLPPFPLLERARELGVDVTTIPGNHKYLGVYSSNKKQISLASPEECVFFHELTHAVDDKLNGRSPGQQPIREVTAELGALVLCQLVGLDGSKHLGTSYHYIEKYAAELGLSPHKALLKVVSKTEKILNFLLKERSESVLA